MLVLENYPILMEQLETLIGDGEVPDNIEFFSGEMQEVLCETFISESKEETECDFAQEVLETDKIVQLLVNFRNFADNSRRELRDHINEIVHEEAAKHINSTLGQIKNAV